MTASSAGAHLARLTEGHEVLTVGHLAGGAVTRDGLEHDDGIVGAHRAREQPLGVGGVRRHHHREPGRVRVRRLDRVGVQFRRADATAVRGTHGDRALEPAPAAVPETRQLADELVVRLHGEAAELDLGERHEAGDREPDRRADDRRFRDGHVEHPAGTEAVERTVGGAEDPAVRADVLAEQHDPLVARHLVEDGLADRREHGHARHETSSCSSSGSSLDADAGAARRAISARCAAVRGLSDAVM